MEGKGGIVYPPPPTENGPNTCNFPGPPLLEGEVTVMSEQ